MNQGILLLFAIPTLCIIVIAFAQFKDEVFKKKFILERRRNREGNGQNPAYNRRYSDRKAPAATSETPSEPSVATDPQLLETSGSHQ
jgi:hypothetical protein